MSIKLVEVVAIMTSMGNIVRWPTKPKNPNGKRNTTKWYEFHSVHRDNTTDCIILHLEVAEMLKRGHLYDLLTNKGKNTLTL